MKKDIFEYQDYKPYLRDYIAAQARRGRGLRTALAQATSSPVSHISQVLNGNSELSLEQAEGVNEFLAHSDEEAGYFFLLVQLSRAGTAALKTRLKRQLRNIQERRLVLKERLGVKAGLSAEDQAIFYSSWIYGAIHVMLSIERFQVKEAISRHLGLSLKRVSEVLEFLVSIGLAQKTEGGRFVIGTARIHLGNDSPMIARFHANWRMQAIRAMDREDFKSNLHYSSAVTVSESDLLRIKSMLVKCIDEVKTVIRDSREEGVHCFAVDFFAI